MTDDSFRFPPRRPDGNIPPGQSYFEMVEKHGKPNGPFDPGRQLPYDANVKVAARAPRQGTARQGL